MGYARAWWVSFNIWFVDAEPKFHCASKVEAFNRKFEKIKCFLSPIKNGRGCVLLNPLSFYYSELFLL